MTAAFLRGFGFTPSEIERMVYGDLKEELMIPAGNGRFVSSRFVQQTLGIEWGRKEIDDELWIAIALVRAENLLSRGINVVIDDLRFPNEWSALAARDDASLWRIERPGMTSTTTHPSEGLCEGLPFDVNVRNEFDIENLENVIHYIMRSK